MCMSQGYVGAALEVVVESKVWMWGGLCLFIDSSPRRLSPSSLLWTVIDDASVSRASLWVDFMFFGNMFTTDLSLSQILKRNTLAPRRHDKHAL